MAPFVATETGCVYRHLFDTAFAEAGVTAPPIVTEADSIATIIRLVASGAGYGLVPRIAVGPDAGRSDVVELPWPGEPPTASLVMMWRRRRVQPPTLALLLQSASEELLPLRPADARLRHGLGLAGSLCRTPGLNCPDLPYSRSADFAHRLISASRA